MFRMTFNIKKWRKHPKSLESDSYQSSFDCLWSSSGSWNSKKPSIMRFSLKIWACIVLHPYFAMPAEWSRNKIMLMSVKSLSTMHMLFKEHGHGWWNQVYSCDVDTEANSSQWILEASTIPKKSWQVRSNVKVTLCFLIVTTIHHEFLPCGQTVNKEYYLKVMQKVREAMRRKRPDLWREKKMIAPSWQHCTTILPSDSQFSHKIWDDGHPPACILSRPCTGGLLSSSSSCSLYWKDDDLTVSRRLKKICWQSYTLFQKRHSRNASETGWGVMHLKWRRVLQRGQRPLAPN